VVVQSSNGSSGLLWHLPVTVGADTACRLKSSGRAGVHASGSCLQCLQSTSRSAFCHIQESEVNTQYLGSYRDVIHVHQAEEPLYDAILPTCSSLSSGFAVPKEASSIWPSRPRPRETPAEKRRQGVIPRPIGNTELLQYLFAWLKALRHLAKHREQSTHGSTHKGGLGKGGLDHLDTSQVL
jgi:hypothetical protein